MKLGSLKDRLVGRLVVVSRDLKRAANAFGVAPTFWVALEKWAERAPGWDRLSEGLKRRRTEDFAFGETTCAKRRFVPSQAADGAAA